MVNLDNEKLETGNSEAGSSGKLEPITAMDCMTYLPASYILGEFIEEGTIVLFSAPEKTGKTYVGLDLALHMAAEMPWLGIPTMQDVKGKVLWINLDMSRTTAMRRIYQITHGIKPSWDVRDPHLFDNFGLIDSQLFRDAGCKDILQFFSESDAVERLTENIIADGVKVCFVDALVQMEGNADENNANDIQKVFSGVKQVRDETGCAFILIHHTTKDGYRGRGSSAIFGETDLNLQLDPCENNGLILKTDGARNTAKQDVAMYKKWTPRLDEDGLSVMKDENGHTIYKFELLPGNVEDMVRESRKQSRVTKSEQTLEDNIEAITALFTQNGNTPLRQTNIVNNKDKPLRGTPAKRKEAIEEAVKRGVLTRNLRDQYLLKSDPGKLEK